VPDGGDPAAAAYGMTGLPPSSAAGWARIGAVLERDGALDARSKAALVACAAAAQGRADLLEREGARLARLGGDEFVAGCAAVLLLSRGADVAGALARAGGVTLVEAAAHAEPAAAAPGDAEAALEYFTGGAPAPGFVQLLADHAPAALVGYRELRTGIYDEAAIGARLAELVLFTVGAATYQGAHAGVHAAKAVEQGATAAELVEAGLCAVPAGGMAAWLVAAGAIATVEAA
jgi:4-carboxymuconolactone decarboxylase